MNLIERMAPATPPFPQEIQGPLDAVMKGKPPIALFTTLARDPRLFRKFFSASLLDQGNLTVRLREIVIGRTTALCKSEYEWGVHIMVFAALAGLEREHISSIVQGGSTDECWTKEEKLVLEMCEQLHAVCTIDDRLWDSLKASFSDEAILELMMLAGFYHSVSILTNSLKLPLEPGAARFSDYLS
jgi:alkylhydroperoxidase family enzyme